MKVYFETYGCTMNQSDTEIMMGQIKKHQIVDKASDSDVVIINSCGVIAYTERKIIKNLEKYRAQGKKIIISGCLPRINPEKVEKTQPDAIITARSLEAINKAFEKIETDTPYKELKNLDIIKSNAHKMRTHYPIAIIPISEGCLGKCSYCGTRFARGKLKSYPIDSIIKETRECIKEGFKEIQITAQDTGAYGKEQGQRLPNLLKEITKIPGEYRIRIGMTNPEHITDIQEELIDAMTDEKIYKFLHLPLQSGDDKVLQDMKREYKAEDWQKIIQTFRDKIKKITISTDIIVGYPTETEESFKKTYEIIKKTKPDIINIKRYSPRPNTPASRLKDMPDRIKKERSRKLTKLHHKIREKNNKKLIGTEQKILITEKGKKGLQGRTNTYKPVTLKKGKIGEFKTVKITDAKTVYLISDT